MRVFEVGEVVHILDGGPIKEDVESMGLTYSAWPGGNENDPLELWYYKGMVGIISKTFADDKIFGGRYRVSFDGLSDDVECDLDFYGQDFEEFYEELIQYDCSEGDLLDLLG